MLTLTRRRWGSIYSLRDEGVSGKEGYMGPWPVHCAQTGGAGCPGVGPDVRGFRRGRMSGAWKVNLPVSVGSLHPWPWGLVRLHVHLREGLLGT